MSDLLPQYQQWIREHVPTPQVAKNRCAELTLAMQARFPELTRVRGHYQDLLDGPRPHWWLVLPDGFTVVDPTVSQFTDGGFGTYQPWDESSPEPTGRCLQCGGYRYGADVCCSQECLLKFTDAVMGRE